MALSVHERLVTLRAVTAIATTKENHIVKLDTSNDNAVLLAAADTDPLFGILRTEPTNTANQEVAVAIDGVSKVKLGGTVARGDYLTSDSAGAAIKITIAQTTVAYTIGQALQSGVSGDIISVQLRPAAVEK